MKKTILLTIFGLLCFACSGESKPAVSENSSSNQPTEKQSTSSVSKRVAPSELTGTPDNSDPKTKINITWKRNATDNTVVEVFLDDKYVGFVTGEKTSYQLNNLNPGQIYKIKVWNLWKQGDVSTWSNEISVTTSK